MFTLDISYLPNFTVRACIFVFFFVKFNLNDEIISQQNIGILENGRAVYFNIYLIDFCLINSKSSLGTFIYFFK